MTDLRELSRLIGIARTSLDGEIKRRVRRGETEPTERERSLEKRLEDLRHQISGGDDGDDV